MVAIDFALLSLAALSVFGGARGARWGSHDGRLPPREDEDSPASGATVPASAERRDGDLSEPWDRRRANPVTITIDLGNHAAQPAVSTSLAAVDLAATAATEGADLSSSSSTDYLYPGGLGAGGTLTTDTNAPTRSIDPSRVSVRPTSDSVIGPPPVDNHPTLNRPPVIPVGDGAGSNGVQSTSTSLLSTKSPSKKPPIVRPTLPTTTPDRDRSTTLDLGHTVPYSTVVSKTYTNTTGAGWNATSVATFPTMTPPSITPNTTTLPIKSNTQSMTTDENGSTLPICAPTDDGKPRTVYSIVYTSTITWYGNPADYTPTYPQLSTPVACMPMKSPFRLTYSYCTSTGTGGLYVTCDMTTKLVYTTPTLGYGQGTINPTVVFLTTDKNPAVVYSTIKTPGYGLSHGHSPGTAQISHTEVGNPGPISTPGYTPPRSQAVHDPGRTEAPKPVTIGVQPTAVVINGHTFTDDPKTRTRTVVVGGETFVISPTKVVGAGATVNRPTMTGGVFVPTPTSTNIAGLPVVVSSSVAVIDGTSFTLGPTPTTTVIRGQTISVGPSGVAIASRTIPVTVFPSATEVVVAGGDLITAIGRSVVVIHGTTITYGPGPASQTTVGGDTITIGPAGVIVHGTTFGGPDAGMSDTQYEIVGGATITQIGPSVVVIGDNTYTVGPGSGSTTTVVDGETVTIGPSGVSVSTYSIPYPFGPTTTITPGASRHVPTAAPTTSKDAGSSLQPDWTWLSFISCIAIGVMGSGF